jgi:hypothetical protein
MAGWCRRRRTRIWRSPEHAQGDGAGGTGFADLAARGERRPWLMAG